MLPILAVSAFLAAFGGTWSCAPAGPGSAYARATPWSIAAAPQSTWARVDYGAGAGGGTAYVGYLALQHAWIYQDFHADGSFADNRSPGPDRDVWTWTGAYITDRRMLHYAVQWKRNGERIERAFGVLVGSSFRASARDVCRRR